MWVRPDACLHGSCLSELSFKGSVSMLSLALRQFWRAARAGSDGAGGKDGTREVWR